MNGTPDRIPASRPSWGWALGSASLVVGLVAFAFPVAPLWFLLSLATATLLLRLTPLGALWVQSERSALFAGVVSHPFVSKYRPVVVGLLFLLPLVMVTTVGWGLSDPSYRWNGGVLWVMAVFGFLVLTVAAEDRGNGRRARWWPAWLLLASAVTVFLIVGGPARVRWAVCQPRLTRVVAAGEAVSRANVGKWCWHDAVQREVDGDVRLYTDGGDPLDDDSGEGVVYSPDGGIATAGSIRQLVDLGNGWYWFRTGSPIRNFWLDG